MTTSCELCSAFVIQGLFFCKSLSNDKASESDILSNAWKCLSYTSSMTQPL